MTEFARRPVLSAAAAGPVLGSVPIGAPARAAAPPSGRQAPGFYRYKVGSHEVTVVTDGANTFPRPENFVVNVKKDEVGAALASAYLNPDSITTPFSPIVVNTGSKLVVIDTGN